MVGTRLEVERHVAGRIVVARPVEDDGVVTFTGGTGRFSGFRATVAVTYTGGAWHWDGTYSFTPPGQDR